MHQCLAIVEIQHAIFRQLSSSHFPGKDSDKATLAGLARTCRTISDAALDALWEELPSIVCLIQCLPRDLWRIECASSICKKLGAFRHTTSMERFCRKLLTFCRPMSLHDWEIFYRYSSRVRSLSLSAYGYTSTTLSEDAISTLSHPPYNRSLIPCIKTLLFMGLNKDYTALLPVLCTHMLVDMVLPSFALRSPEMPTLLPSSLKKFVIQEPNELGLVPLALNSDDQRRLSETIMHLHSLESFECLVCTLDVAAIVHLSGLRSLTKLGITLDLNSDESILESLRHGLVPPAFASISTLTLQVDTLFTLTSLFQVIRFKPQKISCIVKGIPSPDAHHLFFSSLVGACDPVQLSQISLSTIHCRWRDHDRREQISLSTFEPLLVLPNVEHFHFDAMYNISFDDDAISKLAKCWKNLASLSLNASASWGIESQVTHRGLITLLSGCAVLDDFGLEVDFTEIDQPNISETPALVSSGATSPCQFASFGLSRISHPRAIAAFLSDVCPRLIQVSRLTGWWDAMTEDMMTFEGGEEWEEVEKLLLKK